MSLPYSNSERCKCKHLNQNHYHHTLDEKGRINFIFEGDRPCVMGCLCPKFVPDSNLDYLEWKYDQKQKKLSEVKDVR